MEYRGPRSSLVALLVLLAPASACTTFPVPAQPDFAIVVTDPDPCGTLPSVPNPEYVFGHCPCIDSAECERLDPRHPVCDLNIHRCEICLPAAQGGTDTCPPGQHCSFRGGRYTCLTDCATNDDCTRTLGAGNTCCDHSCQQLDSDISNCGACGHVCDPVKNGEPGCRAGACLIGSCHVGFDDCDHRQENGCEVATGTDPANCGGCGQACVPFPNGIPMCANGACSASCAPGFAHCSNNPADGCEVNLASDAKNCGACGKVCRPGPNQAAGTCHKGTCV